MHQPLVNKIELNLPEQAKGLQQSSYHSRVILLVVVLTITRLATAQLMALGNDESYYWLYGQRLQWNYYDHPPMVAVWVRIFTLNLQLEQYEFLIRFGSVISAAFSTWFMYRAVSRIHSGRAGWYAAVLYSTSYYAGIIAGIFIMPDSPQMFFWTLSLWMLARLIYDSKPLLPWIIFGLSTGLCFMSKVHGAFIWTGTIAFVLFVRKEWLKRWQLYLSGLLTLIVICPFVVWNIQNDFATYRLHGNRILVHEGRLNLVAWLEEVTGQLLFNNPVNVVLIAVALISIFRIRAHLLKTSPFIFIGLPIVTVLLIISLSKPVFAHWSGPGYVSLVPVAAIYLDSLVSSTSARRWLKLAAGAYAVFFIGWLVAVHVYPGTWGKQQLPQLGTGDVSLDRYGWDKAGERFSLFYRQQLQSGVISKGTPVLVNKWWGAHIEYYFCRADSIPVIGVGTLRQIGHYAWLNKERISSANTGKAFCIIPSDEYYDPVQAYGGHYAEVRPVDSIPIERAGKVAKYYYVYELSASKKP